MKIAIVHDWLVTYAGAERVLEQMFKVYPQADLFSLIDFLPPYQRGFILDKPVTTSFLQKIPFSKTRYRQYLPLMPLAIEQFDLSGYDLVISSSNAVAKGVLTGPHQLHICYCHTPMRYAWDLHHQYLRESGLDKGLRGWSARWMLHKIRVWDHRTAHGVDKFIANSQYIARRIQKVYRRESTVIYPPVDVDKFTFCDRKDDYYVTASRMAPYKRMDLIVEAFSRMPDRKLVVVGDGPGMGKVKAMAMGNVELLGYQELDSLRDLLQKARAFVFAAEEDFGIAPLEAQSCGTPVIAYGRGGCLETIRGEDEDSPTGVLFPEQTADSLIEGVRKFEKISHRIKPKTCRENALRFSPERFRMEFRSFVEEKYRDELKLKYRKNLLPISTD